MALADTARLLASLELDSSKFTGGADKAIAKTGQMEKSFAKIGGIASNGLKTASLWVQRLSVVAAGFVASQVAFGVKSLADQQAVNAQTAAAIKSTGMVAHVSATQVEELANALEDKTTVDNKEIQAAENLLLTFTNVRNEVGAGNDIFNQSTAILTDMATAMGTDVAAGAIQLGKALNDPVKGISALSRVGVTFDASQQKRITAFVKEGKVAEAQKIILAELNKEFGGSAAAQADTYAGKMRRLGDAVEGVQASLAEALLPTLMSVADEVNGFLRDPGTLAGIKSFGEDLAKGAKSVLTFLKGVDWAAIGNGLKVAGAGAKTIVDAFLAAPPWVQEFLTVGFVANKFTGGAVAGIVGELGKGLIKGVLGMNAGVVNINAGVVNGGVGGAGGGLASAAKWIIPIGLGVALFEAIKTVMDTPETRARDQAAFAADNALHPERFASKNIGADLKQGAQDFARFTAQTDLAAAGVHNFADSVAGARAGLAAFEDWAKNRLSTRLEHSVLPKSEVNAQLRAALRIATSTESTDRKIRELQAIEKDLRTHGHRTSYYVESLLAVERRKKTSVTAITNIRVNASNGTLLRVSTTNMTGGSSTRSGTATIQS